MSAAGSTLVLLVEDNAANQRLLSTVLSKAGYTVQVIGNAEDALAWLSAHRPALILMDMQLPGMDGLTATSMLKADPASRDIPVAAITSFAMKGDESRLRSAGCDAYITKPIRYREFLAEVARLIAGS